MRSRLRGLASRLRKIITAPFRAILWPYRKFRIFLDQEPEDSPTTDVILRAFEEPLLLVDHLEDLRRHLFRALIVLVGMVVLSFAFATRILDFLAEPIGGVEALQSIVPTHRRRLSRVCSDGRIWIGLGVGRPRPVGRLLVRLPKDTPLHCNGHALRRQLSR